MAVLSDDKPEGSERWEDRRSSRRRPLSEIPAITGVTVQSQKVEVIDAASGGLLIQSNLPLRPGSRTSIEIGRADAPLNVGGRVVRSEVAGISGGAIQYPQRHRAGSPARLRGCASTRRRAVALRRQSWRFRGVLRRRAGSGPSFSQRLVADARGVRTGRSLSLTNEQHSHPTRAPTMTSRCVWLPNVAGLRRPTRRSDRRMSCRSEEPSPTGRKGF